MTARQVYDAILSELNKVQAPSVLLEDFNYFFNKAIIQSINKAYNLYDINQQKSDDLRVLKATAVLIPSEVGAFAANNLFQNNFEVYLPDDYVHLLNCIIEYSASKDFKCYKTGDIVQFNAKRLTADMFPGIINNHYLKPKYDNPYYYINNVALDTIHPINETPKLITDSTNQLGSISIKFGTPGTSTLTVVKDGQALLFTYSADWTTPDPPDPPDPPISDQLNPGGNIVNNYNLYHDIVSLQQDLSWFNISTEIVGTDLVFINHIGENITSISETGTYLTVVTTAASISEDALENRIPSYRYGNRSKVRMELRFGKNTSGLYPTKVYIDYLRSHQYIRLTQDQIDEIVDTSQVLEFPDYICLEIVNDLTKLLLENGSDVRLQTHIPINQTIGLQQQNR